MPGYHGKGLYTGQGRLIYSNNGEGGPLALEDPTISSGALAEWFGEGDWQLVRRNQFTEVTGPGDIAGNESDTDPVWSLGWDEKSLILMLLENNEWQAFRLPKGSHSYDGAHGWNTEWPRIRDIGEPAWLGTMHGTFWWFPPSFSRKNTAGIRPRSNYLKVIGDFARWGDRLVIGCDDSAQKEFLNTRDFKAEGITPAQSNSNLWFVEPDKIDHLGPVIGRGSVWLREDVEAGTNSEPYLFTGYDHRQMVIHHGTGVPVTFTLEVDREGDGNWTTWKRLEVGDSSFTIFPDDAAGEWVRVRPEQNAKDVTVHFQYRNRDPRPAGNDAIFDPVAVIGAERTTTGLLRSIREEMGLKTPAGIYALDASLSLAETPNLTEKNFVHMEQPMTGIRVDEASVVVTEDGKSWRIPKNDAYADFTGRICREVATERDLFNLHGTFYELPARNAQGFTKVRPIATHNLAIDDYASHFGLLALTGLGEGENDRVRCSSDGNAAVWLGVVDDLWKLGKPRGEGGPWKESEVKAGEPSDPYLMTGYDKKTLVLESSQAAEFTIEVDVDGTGLWVPYNRFQVTPGEAFRHEFPEGFSAYWVRATSGVDSVATAQFIYE